MSRLRVRTIIIVSIPNKNTQGINMHLMWDADSATQWTQLTLIDRLRTTR